MKSIPAALDAILAAFAPLGSERVGLHDAQGRVLSESLCARFDMPSFNNSAMDGYAVRSEEVAGASAESPVWLPLAGESKAGDAPPAELTPGHVLRIFTGAPMPPGADAVVMQEDTQREGERVGIQLAPTPARHVRRRGGDLAAGQEILTAGTRLGPGELGLLASQQHAQVSVARRPRVALLSTGDELRDVSDPLAPGQIVNSNAYALAAQVREAGGEPWILPIVPDRLEETVSAVRAALRADLLVSIGGVSVGEYDFVRDAFAEAGVEQQFWKIAIKPGKPLSFGVREGVPVIGLPGNPVSAMVTFEVFVRPAIRRMLGDPRPFRASGRVRLAEAHTHRPGRTELARATLERGPEGFLAHLHSRQGSGSLPSMVGVEALVVLPTDQGEFEAGEVLTALLLHDTRGSEASAFGSA